MNGMHRINIKHEEGHEFATFGISDVKANTPNLVSGQVVEIAVDFGNMTRAFQATYKNESTGERLIIDLGKGATITLTKLHKCDVSTNAEGRLFYHLHTR